MRRLGARALAAAYLLDLIVGDPQGAPHPTRAMGWAIARAERLARRHARGPQAELLAGALVAVAVAGGSYAASAGALALAARLDRRLATALDVVLAAATIATRDLLAEARTVLAPLERGDLPAARERLARIVGRDTAGLDAAEIARAAIETIAESLCDGIVAPLCVLALLGTPAAFAFKAISTLDSMIGHIEPPYRYLGRASARLDDLANYLPARLTALLIVVAAAASGHGAGAACSLWLRDGGRHRSPNAGQSEAAMAGALGVRLGGTNYYEGTAREGALLGAELPPPAPADLRAALEIARLVSFLAALAAIGVRSGIRA